MNKVIYTAIIGDYDDLKIPKFIPDGFDFVCFTTSDVKSDFWDVRKVTSLYEDNTRTARKYKVLPHRYLSEYDISIWLDGNQYVVGDYNDIINRDMVNVNMVCYDHNECRLDPRKCIYEEAHAILLAGKNHPQQKYKDNPQVITDQMIRYQEEKYPQNNGLIVSGVMLRRHNEKDVINTMEMWWEEIKYGSRRDQLSFNYCAWKSGLNFVYLKGDIRDDGYTLETRHKNR